MDLFEENLRGHYYAALSVSPPTRTGVKAV
jgi:hypothetical protein